MSRPRDPGMAGRVIDLTIRHIADHGLQGANAHALCREARIGKASFYRRWPDLEHLLADVVRQLRAEYRHAMAEGLLLTCGPQVRGLVESDP